MPAFLIPCKYLKSKGCCRAKLFMYLICTQLSSWGASGCMICSSQLSPSSICTHSATSTRLIRGPEENESLKETWSQKSCDTVPLKRQSHKIWQGTSVNTFAGWVVDKLPYSLSKTSWSSIDWHMVWYNTQQRRHLTTTYIDDIWAFIYRMCWWFSNLIDFVIAMYFCCFYVNTGIN